MVKVKDLMFKCMQLQHVLDMIPITQEPQAKGQGIRSHLSNPGQNIREVDCTVCCQCQHPLPCHNRQDLGNRGVRVALPRTVAVHMAIQAGIPGVAVIHPCQDHHNGFGQSIGIGSNVLGYLTEKDIYRSKDLSLIKVVRPFPLCTNVFETDYDDLP